MFKNLLASLHTHHAGNGGFATLVVGAAIKIAAAVIDHNAGGAITSGTLIADGLSNYLAPTLMGLGGSVAYVGKGPVALPTPPGSTAPYNDPPSAAAPHP